jgi:hypothetical protein
MSKKANKIAAAKDTNLGPNEKFPFGIKLVDAKGNISWERFKTAADRDKRMDSVKGGKRVDYSLNPPAAAATKGRAMIHAVVSKAIAAGSPIVVEQPAAAAQPPATQPPAKPATAAQPQPAKPAAAAKPAAKPAAAAKPKGDEMAIHLNKTGRLCFGKEAAAYLGAKKPAHMALAIEGKLIRLKPAKSEGEDTCRMGDAAGRPYISAMREFRKAFGFDGSQSLDFTAKPYGQGGFEFRW